ncbi:SLC13 family permease [Sporolactobacillus sp. CQH2019]|uniref:GntP family permease n=1 Tax=Sporolactobacillus sp. CQH2019 TaxID=3023512 RepID=UPI002367D811|nr:SLC13 family permease [Sporolactobacillus sp. CQH2019]MDD9148181.1 SLC13 family permease [Sporolactobacillus sp. CQH2019]
MNILIICIGLIILAYFCFKGVPTPISGILCSALVLLLFRMNVYDGLMATYMTGFVNFIKSYFIMLLFGSLFGKIMEISGAADSIAEKVVNLVGKKSIVLGMALTTLILTVSGISIFVCIFAVLPIALQLCKKANLPRYFIIGAFTIGAYCGSTAPFTPSIYNVVPTRYLGTTVAAAWIPGLISCIVYFVLAMIWMSYWEKRERARGACYRTDESEVAAEAEFKAGNKRKSNFILAILPIILLLLALNVAKLSVEYSLLVGCISAVVLQFKTLPHVWQEIKNHFLVACSNTMSAAINTAAVVGFGAVVAATSGFETLIHLVAHMGGNPLLGGLITTGALAGITGSSSGGIAMAAPILQKYFLPLTNAQALHRVATVTSLSLGSLPNCGFLQTEFNLTQVDFKESYLYMVFPVGVVLVLFQAVLTLGLSIVLGMG